MQRLLYGLNVLEHDYLVVNNTLIVSCVGCIIVRRSIGRPRNSISFGLHCVNLKDEVVLGKRFGLISKLFDDKLFNVFYMGQSTYSHSKFVLFLN